MPKDLENVTTSTSDGLMTSSLERSGGLIATSLCRSYALRSLLSILWIHIRFPDFGLSKKNGNRILDAQEGYVPAVKALVYSPVSLYC